MFKATFLQSSSRARRLDKRKSYGPSICHHALEKKKKVVVVVGGRGQVGEMSG